MYITKERYEELIEQAVGCQMFMDTIEDISLTDNEKMFQMLTIYDIKKEQMERRKNK